MNTNKSTIVFTCISIILIISIPTIYKVVKKHNNNLYKVTENKIIEAAKRCFYEEKCLDEKIYLRDLYNLKFLEQVNNPITKEYYNENSYVERNNSKFTFIIVE